MKKVLLFTLAISILASCTTSNEVVSNKLFQKRKYQKGWHVNSTKKVDRTKKSKITEYEETLVAQNENEKQENNPVQTKEQSKTDNEISNQTLESKANLQSSPVIVEQNREELEVVTTNESNGYLLNTDNNPKEEYQVNKDEEVITEKQSNNSSGHSMLLMVILCLFLPPVAVGLLRGWSSNEFLISLVLFVIGWGLFALSPLASLASLAGIVYAFLILFDKI